MELAERMEESVDDITAAATAPKPMKETQVGVRYCRTRGRMLDAWSLGIGTGFLSIVAYVVAFQSKCVLS